MLPQHIHILGICGRATAGLAVLLKHQGHQVTGSDQGAYPPMSDFLIEHGIHFNTTYAPEHIPPETKLVLVGGNTLHIDLKNPEYIAAQKQQIPIQPWAYAAGQLIAKPESLVVTGTYGKTTISALLTKIFIQAGKDPSFLIGDRTQDFPNNLHISSSNYSIMEGDEHPTLGIDPQPKFLHYKPKYAIITSTIWDHFNIYPTQSTYLNAFRSLINQIPIDGTILANQDNPELVNLLKETDRQIYWYGVGVNRPAPAPVANFYATDISFNSQGSTFTFHHSGKPLTINLPLLGQHNIHNATAAIALSLLLDIQPLDIKQAISEFKGISGRLELISDTETLKIYKDIGQHPQKAQGAINALRAHYPDSHLTIILDPHASVLHQPEVLDYFSQAFSAADRVLILPLKHRQQDNRVTGGDLVRAIQPDVANVQYCPSEEKAIEILTQPNKQSRIYLFLSTRDLSDVTQQIT